MTVILYLAKPTIGGWVTFTSHLHMLKGYPIYKIAKRTEQKNGIPRLRDFGYGCKYQNITLSDLLLLKENIIVTAIDRTKHNILQELPDNTNIVIHDPTELKQSKQYLLQLILQKPNFKYITIRVSVHNYLLKNGIKSTNLLHPYVNIADKLIMDKNNINKTEAISISRIDYDKHTEIILSANSILINPILIYGTKNDRYVYHKLRTIDSMCVTDPSSNYMGSFPKCYNTLKDILIKAKFVVDLSRIKDDGGGTQYTHLEAINFGCALILHSDWTNTPNSIYKDGYNCYTVSNHTDLAKLINNNPDVNEIVNNSKLLLDNNIQAHGW